MSTPEARDMMKRYIELFWVFFPSIEVLHEAKAFKKILQCQFHLTILNSRRFNGVIYKEENVYGDRRLHERKCSINLLESERVKEKFVILNKICGIINFIFNKINQTLIDW
jgi:hypothetical protein